MAWGSDLLQPCGTAAAARRHHRNGEPLCAACTAAAAQDKAIRSGTSRPLTTDPRAIRNGLPVTPGYSWRTRTYPWAQATIAAAEAVHGRPRRGIEPAPEPVPEPDTPCACGCGQMFAQRTTGRPRQYALGHAPGKRRAASTTPSAPPPAPAPPPSSPPPARQCGRCGYLRSALGHRLQCEGTAR